MYPPSVEYIRAESLVHAVDLLDDHGPHARVIAGGQSLVPLLKFRLAAPDVIVDISYITPIAPIRSDEHSITIHALTTHADVNASDIVTTEFDVIRDALPQLADPQVRNMGTVGGGIAEADPSGDWGPLVFLTDGIVRTVSVDGEREFPVTELFTGAFQTSLGHTELITDIELPRTDSRTGGAYLKVKRRQGVYATISLGVHVGLDENEHCTKARIACNSIQSSYGFMDASSRLAGDRLTTERIQRVLDDFASSLTPARDTRGTAGFKRNLARRLGERAFTIAVRRAQGETVSPDPMEVV